MEYHTEVKYCVILLLLMSAGFRGLVPVNIKPSFFRGCSKNLAHSCAYVSSTTKLDLRLVRVLAVPMLLDVIEGNFIPHSLV
jgi:hypothetical protein